jgi:ABC-type polysaccharide/polyol phosphate transport system ATPase subunit
VDPIRFEHVSKHFRRRGVAGNYHTLKAILSRKPKREAPSFEALREVTFSVGAGETFALIGPNGAGKSTVLKLASGIYQADRGTVCVDGRIGSLIELGLGFHPEFTGRENVLICGLLQGMTRREVAARLGDIVEFAALGEFIDEPVRTYSSGMYMRLGFSIAIHCDPTILLIDEVLAVGDAAFQRRCLDRLIQLRNSGRTILMATHALDLVRDVCRRAAWMDHGRIRAIGDARTVADDYEASVGKSETG